MEGPRHYHHYYHGKPAETLGDQLRKIGFWTLMVAVVIPAGWQGLGSLERRENLAQAVGCAATGAVIVPLGIVTGVAGVDDKDASAVLNSIGDVICPGW